MIPLRGEAFLTEPDRRFVRRVAVANITVLSFLATTAWLVWAGLPTVIGVEAPEPGARLVLHGFLVLVTTSACGLVALTVWRLARPLLTRPPFLYETVYVLGAIAAGLPQALVLAQVDGTPVDNGGVLVLWAAASLGYSVSITAALLTGGLLINYRRSEQERRDEEAAAAASLEAEELRIRQLVADELHGTVQGRLVAAAATLDDLAAEDDSPRAARLRQLADGLDELAQEDVRSISHALFPTGANLDAFDAVRLLLARLPPSVATEITLGDGLRSSAGQGAPIPVPLRLVVVYAVEEAVTNAVKHGARSVRVRADLVAGRGGGAELRVHVDDDGSGLDEPEPTLHGLERHRARVHARGGTLRLEPRSCGGARLSIVLPVPPEETAVTAV